MKKHSYVFTCVLLCVGVCVLLCVLAHHKGDDSSAVAPAVLLSHIATLMTVSFLCCM